MASFKLCYYGDGGAVTIPLAWIIKSEGEAEGSRAGADAAALLPLPSARARGKQQELLRLVFIRNITLPADAIKETQEIGAGDLLTGQLVTEQAEQNSDSKLCVTLGSHFAPQ